MASHHLIGSGELSAALDGGVIEPETLARQVAELVADCGLAVVSHHFAHFDGGGLTLVWILAESHLVLHLWRDEGYATLDLHVCDFRTSNAERARSLAEALSELCFAPGSGHWEELRVEAPVRRGAAELW